MRADAWGRMDFIIGFTVSRPKDCYDSRDWCYGFETMTFVVEPLLSRTMFTPFQSEGWRRKHEAGKEGESLLVAAGGSERRRSGKEELFQKEDHNNLNDKKIKKRTENLREIIRFMYIVEYQQINAVFPQKVPLFVFFVVSLHR